MATREVYFSDGGTPKTGLSPVFSTLKKVASGDDVTPPVITEIGGGWYKFDINPTEKYVGVIDGTSSVTVAGERYVPVFFDVYDFLYEAIVAPVYDEDSDSLTFMAFLLKNGQRVTTLLTNCEIKVYDQSHTLLFTISSVSSTNGVFVITKSTPGLTKNENYYVTVTVTYDGVDHVSTDSFIALE